MGHAETYRCPKCGYEALVAGGRTFGFYSVVETISCRACQVLYDAEANEKAEDVVDDGRWQHSTLTGIQCPKSAKHEFDIWKEPWPCPKCGEPMEAGGPCQLWD